MKVYLDTSIYLRWITNHPQSFREFLKWDSCYSSEFLYIEFHRVINRMRLENQINDVEFGSLRNNFLNFYDSIHVIQYTSSICDRASQAFPTIIGTLDAIHLSSALLLKESKAISDLILLTHDKQMAVAARAMGLEVKGIASLS